MEDANASFANPGRLPQRNALPHRKWRGLGLALVRAGVWRARIDALSGPDGRIGHAEIEIGDSHVMLADKSLERDAKSPATFGGSPVSLHLYVPDVDAGGARAIKAGARLEAPVEDQFYGDRMGIFARPFRSHLAHFHAYQGCDTR